MSDPLPPYSQEQLALATQAIFASAEAEARTLGDDAIAPEHLLVALLADQDNLGARALNTFGITYRRARKALDYIHRRHRRTSDPPPEHPSEYTLGLAPRAVAAVTLARQEAMGLHIPLITPELLLIGIIREGDGIAAGILLSLGADLERIRAQVYAQLVSAGKVSEASVSKGNVITCRIGDQDLAAIDALVEAGVRTTRSEATAWLIHAGVEANKTLLDTVYGTVAEIRRLRVIAQTLAQDASESSPEQEA
jgi:Arc/MetJ-type ribon-helix-helix transcriptional regulator